MFHRDWKHPKQATLLDWQELYCVRTRIWPMTTLFSEIISTTQAFINFSTASSSTDVWAQWRERPMEWHRANFTLRFLAQLSVPWKDTCCSQISCLIGSCFSYTKGFRSLFCGEWLTQGRVKCERLGCPLKRLLVGLSCKSKKCRVYGCEWVMMEG